MICSCCYGWQVKVCAVDMSSKFDVLISMITCNLSWSLILTWFLKLSWADFDLTWLCLIWLCLIWFDLTLLDLTLLAYLLACLFTYLLACLFTYLLAYLFTCLFTYWLILTWWLYLESMMIDLGKSLEIDIIGIESDLIGIIIVVGIDIHWRISRITISWVAVVW